MQSYINNADFWQNWSMIFFNINANNSNATAYLLVSGSLNKAVPYNFNE
jgi:hypothetical protein